MTRWHTSSLGRVPQTVSTIDLLKPNLMDELYFYFSPAFVTPTLLRRSLENQLGSSFDFT